MLGPIDSEASAGYLTLSVFAQSLVERLLDPPTESDEEREEAIDGVIRVLESVGSPERLKVATAAGLRPFQKHGQVKTLYDILAPSRAEVSSKLDELIRFLKGFRDSPRQVDDRTREKFADLFDKLATKALYRSRRPSEAIPAGVRKLCQQT